MAYSLVWIEDSESRQATICRKGKKAPSTYTKSWKITGTTDDVVLHQEINTKLSAQYEYWQYPNKPDMKLRAEEYTVSYIGGDVWQLSVRYEKTGAEDGAEPLKRSRSFDTTGGQQHITQAAQGDIISTEGNTVTTASPEKRFPPSAPMMNGAIGVDSNGVNGVDIVCPQLQWQEQYDVPNVYVTTAYIKGIAATTGTVNNAAFRGFAKGEVLFLGCSGSQEWDDQKGRGPWSLTYRFAASSNVTNKTVGDITGIDKKGHEYLWVRYEDAVSSNSLIKKPKFVYVDKVYMDGDFSLLGIGTE